MPSCLARRGATVVLAILVCLAAALPAQAGKRVALVIGNSAYTVGPLANPVNDAKAVAGLLGKLGFDTVITKTDLGRQQMQEALQELGAAAAGAELALVFYAGHGTENAGVNYLIPVDAPLARAADLKLQAISLDAVIDQMAGATRLKLVILDACRNNIFPLAGSQRSQTRGLARMEPEDNTLIAYAAKAGTTADDGRGANSPFTSALLKRLPTPGIDVRLLLGQVRDDVLSATGGAQQPHVYGTLGGQQVTIAAAAPGAPAPYADAAELARLKAEIEALKRKQSEQQANLAPPPKPEPLAKPEPAAPVPAKPEPARPSAPAASADMKPGTVFRDCPECPEMVVVPAGSFMMGSSPSEIAALTKEYGDGYVKHEGPQRKVTIGKPFTVGRFEVTVGEYLACVAAKACNVPAWQEPGSEDNYQSGSNDYYKRLGAALAGNSHPVVGVRWANAKQYLSWLSKSTGKAYRLLSEAEWEYAARGVTVAGQHPRYHFGNDAKDLCDYANGADQTAKAKFPKWTVADCKDGHVFTAPAGSFKPNTFGLFDMHGNVYEWVEDCYHDNYRGAPTDGTANTSGVCNRRVIRGGSWSYGPVVLRSASRYWQFAVSSDPNLGFRVARSLD